MKETESASESRRKRVNRIKRAIIAILMILIITPTILCVWLAFRVSSLEDKLDSIMNSSLFVEREKAQKSAENNKQVETANATAKIEVATQTETAVEQTQTQAVKSTSGKKVYLTFDDGPSKNTDKILDILDKYNVKGTFFVIYHDEEGMAQKYKDIVKRGHSIGIHSYSHNYDLVYKNLDSFKKDVTAIQDYVYETTGERTWLYRFPGGTSNLVSSMDIKDCIKYINDSGFTYYDWNVSSTDSATVLPSAERIVDIVISEIMDDEVADRDSYIVLMHDSDEKNSTVEALPKLIEKLQSMDVEILPITKDAKAIHHIDVN